MQNLIHAETGDGIIVVADETTDNADQAVMAVSIVTTTHLFLFGLEPLATGEHISPGYAASVMRIWGRFNLEGTALRRFVTDNDLK